MSFTESDVEASALEYFTSLGYTYVPGPDLLDGPSPERSSPADVILLPRLRAALERLNPRVPARAIDAALSKLLHHDVPTLVANNRAFHKQLTRGITVEIPGEKGKVEYPKVRLVDFSDPTANDFLVVNQLTVKQDRKKEHRPDIVVFVNGLPLAVIELKNATNEKTGTAEAIAQLQTYKRKDRIESLFVYNAVLVASDGVTAQIGSLTAGAERFMPWRTIEGEREAPTTDVALEVLVRGVFEKRRFLELVRSFTVFEASDDGTVEKKIAGYHQFHAVQTALGATLRATAPDGSRKVGVVWHTQGSGKSLTMVFYAGRIIRALGNPTIVVITDRNDLDDQLFGTFARCEDLLRQAPQQVEDRDDLKTALDRASGGIIFTTIQKFMPAERGGRMEPISARTDIVVMADEAHRSQYGLTGRVVKEGSAEAFTVYGYAKHLRDALPNASFIGFTGTPVELDDRSTRSVFGEHISVYDIQQAVEDKATVPIYFESRVAKLRLDEERRPKLDEDFEEVTENEEETYQGRLKTKWAALQALVGAPDRLEEVAQDLVDHFERRNAAMPGKAMIVCMSRDICVRLYDAVRALRPEWHHEDDEQGQLKVVMTGNASNKPHLQPHLRSKGARATLAKRFKNASDPFKLVIVRDMWLTGFDAPCLHTMYVDKPMHGHGLMQAIARVNRVFRDKPGGLVVDYIGLADSLRRAMRVYTRSGGRGSTTEDASKKALPVLLAQLEVCRAMFHGFDYGRFFSATTKPSERLALLPAAQEHILAQEDGKDRYVLAVTKLTKANALACALDEAKGLQDEIAFFQGIKACMVKTTRKPGKTPDEVDLAVQQIVASAIISDEVIDVFSAAGLSRPDISILSDEFLTEVRAIPYTNVAAELLRKLLEEEIKVHARTNIIQSRKFSEMLTEALSRYHKRSIETLEVIEELIDLATKVRDDRARGEKLGLGPAEIAFYDALAANQSARELMKDEVLRQMATELAQIIRKNVTIDWTVRENVQANMRRLVKRLLRKYRYPPDLQESATQTVLTQAKLLADEISRPEGE